MSTTSPPVTVREFTDFDRESVLALSDRLLSGVAGWRDQDAVAAAVHAWLEASTSSDFSGVALVADAGGKIVGFVSVSTDRHFSGEIDAYLGELVVDVAHEGTGVGTALITAAETVARRRGHRCLTLTTGAANHSATKFYSSRGYESEDVKLTKLL